MDKRWQLSYFLHVVILTTMKYAFGKVEIVRPYHPLYVKSSETLTLVCKSYLRVDLQWVRQTPNTSWKDSLVVPTLGSDFITRNMTEEPSGYRETTLIKNNMDISDRGMYLCRDVAIENTFAVWVTVLKILKTNDFRPSSTSKFFLLHCNISGFDNNFPDIQYQWSFNNQSIPRDHMKYVYGSSDEGRIHLNVTNAGTSDSGVYECSFILTTNLGLRTFTESINVDGGALVAGADKMGLCTSMKTLMLISLLVIYI